MCNFISWLEKEVDGNTCVLYLTDDEVFGTKKGKELQKYVGSKVDLVGHGAISHYLNVAGKGYTHMECENFADPKRFPPEIVADIKLGKFKKLSRGSLYAVNLKPLLNKASWVKIRQDYWAVIEKYLKFKKGYKGTKKELLEVKKAVKQVFDKDKKTFLDNQGGVSILQGFYWGEYSCLHENYKWHWNDMDEKLVKVPDDFVIFDVSDAVWDAFKDKKNRSKAWK